MLSFGELRSLAQAKPTARRWEELLRALEGAQELSPARYEQELAPYLSAHLERWDESLCPLPWRWIEADEAPSWLNLARSLSLQGAAQVNALAQYLERHPERELGVTTLNIEHVVNRWRSTPQPEQLSHPELSRLKALERLSLYSEDKVWLAQLLARTAELSALSLNCPNLVQEDEGLIEQLKRPQSLELITSGPFELLHQLERWAAETLTTLSFGAQPQRAAEVIIELPRLPKLERLTLRSEAFNDANLLRISSDEGFTAQIRHLCLSHQFTSATSIQPILEGAGWPALERLELISLEGSALDLGRIRRPLRELRLESALLLNYHTRQIADCEALTEHLEALTITRQPMSLDDLEALINAPFKRLKTLRLISCNISSKGVERLCQSALAQGLEELDLSYNNVRERGVEELARALMPQLKRLRLCGFTLRSGQLDMLCRAQWFPQLSYLELDQLGQDHIAQILAAPSSQEVSVLRLS